MEKRNLSAAYEFYCDKKLVNAHSAEADTLATYEILLKQVKMYDNLQSDIDFLSKFSNIKMSYSFKSIIILGFREVLQKNERF